VQHSGCSVYRAARFNTGTHSGHLCVSANISCLTIRRSPTGLYNRNTPCSLWGTISVLVVYILYVNLQTVKVYFVVRAICSGLFQVTLFRLFLERLREVTKTISRDVSSQFDSSAVLLLAVEPSVLRKHDLSCTSEKVWSWWSKESSSTQAEAFCCFSIACLVQCIKSS
jgi:hypothetical protein